MRLLVDFVKLQLLPIFRDITSWFSYCVFGRMLSRLSLVFSLKIARSVGRLTAWFNPLGRRYQNMVNTLLPSLSATAGKKFCSHLPEIFCERMKEASLGNAISMESLISLEGIKHLDDAMAEGKGAILVCSHFGACSLGLGYLGLRGYPLHIFRAVGKRPGGSLTAGLRRKIGQYRMSLYDGSPINTIFYQPGSNPIFSLFKILARGEIVVILPDGGVGRQFHDAAFLNGRLQLASGFAHLAKAMNAPVVPFFCVREESKYRATLEHPFYVRHADDASIQIAVDHFSMVLGEYFCKYPDQWNLLNKLQLQSQSDSGWKIVNPGPAAKKFFNTN